MDEVIAAISDLVEARIRMNEYGPDVTVAPLKTTCEEAVASAEFKLALRLDSYLEQQFKEFRKRYIDCDRF